jgi:beta-glucosidase/6-phospho-beta-glucosidase/beta-galactosidase
VASTLHQIEAHAAMYDAIHAEDRTDANGDGRAAKVGVVLNMAAIHPKDPDKPADHEAAADLDHLYHRLFLDGLTTGDWDDDLDGTFDRKRPDLANRLDYIGVNYYARVEVARLSIRLVEEIPSSNLYPDFSWDPYVEGMAEVVRAVTRYGLPIYITENGVGIDNDLVRDQGLRGHLDHLHVAIEEGADVRGYFYWSFVDNYEWNHGMDMRFGLYALDLETKERSPRDVLELYRRVVQQNGLDGEGP